jgi:CubicO group peptidase (beta-lactamase class C family)
MLGIDDNLPPLTAVEKQATVRMLLQARSGVYHPALYGRPRWQGADRRAAAIRQARGGRQIVPAAWVRESTRSYSDLGESMGYGYLWWIAPRVPATGVFGEGWFSAIGAGGQYAFVQPELDLVVVSRVDRDLKLPEPRFADFAEFPRLVAKAGCLDQTAR